MTATTRPLLTLAAVLALLAAGCGGSPSVSGTTTTHLTAASSQASEASLKSAVRAAIRANVRLSLYVLWHNDVPGWAIRSTRGPALKALRAAAAARRGQGIRIKNLSGHYTILSISLTPSYATATAVVRDTRRTVPFKAGHRLGKAIVGTDHSRVELHRVGDTRRFIVWSVSAVR